MAPVITDLSVKMVECTQHVGAKLFECIKDAVTYKSKCEKQLSVYLDLMKSYIDRIKEVAFALESSRDTVDLIKFEIVLNKMMQFTDHNSYAGSYIVNVMKSCENTVTRRTVQKIFQIFAGKYPETEKWLLPALNTYSAIIYYVDAVLDENKFTRNNFEKGYNKNKSFINERINSNQNDDKIHVPVVNLSDNATNGILTTQLSNISGSSNGKTSSQDSTDGTEEDPFLPNQSDEEMFKQDKEFISRLLHEIDESLPKIE